MIVGAGYAGLRFFAESLELTLAQHLTDSIRYVFVDERPRSSYGRGVAWASDQNPHMRTNMHIPEITADPATGKTIAEMIGISYDHQPTATELFAKREDVGAVFADQFNKCEEKALEHGIEIFSIEDEAVDLERHGINYKVTLASGRNLEADYIVLALGHIPPTTHSHLFDCRNFLRNPWIEAKRFNAIDRDSRVAVVGLGPTAVDTIIKLRDGGVAAIRAYSRSGAMQYPRPIPGKFVARILTESNIRKIAAVAGVLKLDVLIGMVASEFLIQGVDWTAFLAAVQVSRRPPLDALRHGYANCDKTADWFGLVACLTDAIPIAWHLLDDEDRPKFQALHSKFSNVLYGMAPSHALRMLRELEDRTLSVQSGLEGVFYDQAQSCFILRSKVDGVEAEDHADYVIDCSGFGRDLTLSHTKLVTSLLKRDYLRPHPFGGAVVNFASGQVARVEGRAMRIYCLTGSLNIGVRFVTNGLGEVAGSAFRTAQAIHSRLDDLEHGRTRDLA